VKKAVQDCEFMFVAAKCDLLPPDGPDKVRADAERLFEHYQPRGYSQTSAVTHVVVDRLFRDAAELFVPKQCAKKQTRDRQDPVPKKEQEAATADKLSRIAEPYFLRACLLRVCENFVQD
jgi:hypothetical protein